MKYGYFKGKKVAEVQDSQASLMDNWKKRGLVDEWRDTESDPKQAAELAAEKAEAERLAAEKAEAERLAVEKEAAEKAKDQHYGGGSGPTGTGGYNINSSRGGGGGGGQSGMGGGKRNN